LDSSDASAELSFDKATYATKTDAGGGAPCAHCNGPLGEQYWQWQSRPVCATCRTQLSDMLVASQSKKSFGRAMLLGGLTALGCGIAYAIFVAVTDYQLALVTIGIAFLIAKVMRRCSAGVGGRKYQLLAVGLTYLASAMGYVPGVYAGLAGGGDEKTSAAPTSAPSTVASAPETSETKTRPAEDHVGIGGLIAAIALLFAITLAAPVLAATQAPMGLLIIAFGLWEAWKLSRGLPLSLDGPYRVAPEPAPEAAPNP
jgi:hypothetical protein